MFRSLFMPFSILELDIDYRNSRELQKIIEARTVLPLQNIYSDPVKNAEALFLSEVLCQTIKEPEPNLPLFAFIARSIQVLNIMEEGKANFHLCFLLQLCSFLGFSHNMETYRTGYSFDMLNGIFSPSRPIHTYTLDAREAEVFARLTRMDFNNLRHFKFNRGERNAILDRILTYYGYTNPTFRSSGLPKYYEPYSTNMLQRLTITKFYTTFVDRNALVVQWIERKFPKL